MRQFRAWLSLGALLLGGALLTGCPQPAAEDPDPNSPGVVDEDPGGDGSQDPPGQTPDSGQNPDPNGGDQPDDPDGDHAGDPDPNDVPDEPVPPAVFGVWRFENGLYGANSGHAAAYLVLDEHGHVQLIGRNDQTHALRVVSGSYASIGDLVLIVQLYEDYPEILYYTADDEHLVVTQWDGLQTTLSRAAALPPEYQIRPLREVTRHTGLPEPYYGTGLVYDGQSLLYLGYLSNTVQRVDPDTGALGTPLTLSSHGHVHAFQEGSFWAHCNCGGSTSVQRRTPADVLLDQIRFFDDLALDFGVEAIAVDGSNGNLWVYGELDDDNQGRFLKLDTSGEPDVLLETIEFDHWIRAMVWHDGYIWALVSWPYAVYQIDTTTAKVVATYDVPDKRTEFDGMTVIDGRIFLVGTDYLTDEAEGVIVELSTEPSGS